MLARVGAPPDTGPRQFPLGTQRAEIAGEIECRHVPSAPRGRRRQLAPAAGVRSDERCRRSGYDFGIAFAGSTNGFGTTVASRSPTSGIEIVRWAPSPACSIGTIA